MTFSKLTNSIEITIGGALRILKYNMRVQEKISDLLIDGGDQKWMANPQKLVKILFFHGLNHKDNNLPTDFEQDTVLDWIDEMDQEAFDLAQEFAMEAMGFITSMMAGSAENLTKSLGSLAAKAPLN